MPTTKEFNKAQAKRTKLESKILKLLREYEEEFPEMEVLNIHVSRQPTFSASDTTGIRTGRVVFHPGIDHVSVSLTLK